MSSFVSCRGSDASVLALASELWGLLLSSGGSVNLTSLSVRLGTVATGFGLCGRWLAVS